MNEYLLNKYVSLCGFEGLSKKEVGWNFRCYICGDSKHTKRKKRGWVLYNNQGQVTYYCFNCGADISFINFLKEHKMQLYQDYKKELLKSGNIRRKRINTNIEIKSSSYESLKKAVEKSANNSVLKNLDDLNSDAKQWCKDRKLPDWLIKELKYTNNYMKFIHDNKIKELENIPKKDRRVVIPYYNNENVLTYLQGRAIDKVDDAFRYITSKITKRENECKIWGMNRVDSTKEIRVSEGVFDACFIKNCIALTGSGGDWKYIIHKYGSENLIFILDNDIRRNTELKKIANKVLKKGVKLFFWPKDIEVKDMNDLVKSGWTESDIENMIVKNTYSNIEAETRLKLLR